MTWSLAVSRSLMMTLCAVSCVARSMSRPGAGNSSDLGLQTQADRTANELLKQVFRVMHSVIATSVNPDTVMDVLLSKKVLDTDDVKKLRQVPASSDRCRDMMSLLFISKDPQAFIRLRLALLDEYPWIVDEIDKKLPSLTSQLQQLHLGHSADGKHLLPQIIVSYRKI